MSEGSPRSSLVAPAGTPLPRRRALTLGVLALGCVLGARGASAESVPSDLRLFVERSIPGANQSATVYADGVVVWNREREVRIQTEDVARLLRLFRDAGFDAMPDQGFGTGKKWLLRRASLRRDGRTKQVVQLVGGQQSVELERLVDTVVAAVEPKPGTGVAAASLADGLRKLSGGELAPQCLGIVAFRKPELGRSGPSEGWLLQLQEGTATASAFSAGGFVDPRALSLDRARLTRLVEALLAAEVESLPGNLYAPDYRELTLSVLNREKNLTARAFAGLTATKLGEKQTLFERAFSEIEALSEEVRQHGHKVAPPRPAPPLPRGREEG
jgi:hypothetical protein